jgi:hypothetical protein
MRSCYQSSGVAMLAHGEAVREQYERMARALEQGEAAVGKTRPSWLNTQTWPLFVDRLFSPADMALYQRYHDCGKPHCRTVGPDGRQHFPQHAKVSSQVWRSHGGGEGVARLIEQDMDIHLLKSDGVLEFSEKPEAASLLLTGLAEVYANAEMFGGQTSVRFKMKFKHLERRGRAIVQAWQLSS